MVTTPYRYLTATDAAELLGRVAAARDRFVALAGSVDPSLQPAGSTWTARDITGHLLTVLRRYTRRDRSSTEGLADSPREVDRLNAVQLAALGDTPRDALLADLVAESNLLLGAFPPDSVDLHTRYPFHGGVTVDLAAGFGNLVGEFSIHGRDLALAAGRPWPIEERDAVLILNGVMQIIPAYARRSATQPLRVRLDIRTAAPWLLDFAGGSLTSRAAEPGEPVDVVLRAPAQTLVLSLYSRLSTLAAARAGMLVVGGRRPWRIVRLSRLVEKP
jgi:uncharacterized protein (TIGR03083 family)